MQWIPAIVAVVIVAWFVGTYNRLVRLRNQIKNAWHQIEVQLKRRYDLIPNLVEVVKDYMAYEQETLTRVVAARGAAIQAKGTAEQAKAKLQELQGVGVDQFNIYLMTHGQEETLQAFGDEIIPELAATPR